MSKREKYRPARNTIGQVCKIREWKVDFYFRGFGVYYTIKQNCPLKRLRGKHAQIVRPWGNQKTEYGKNGKFIVRVFYKGCSDEAERVVLKGKWLRLWDCYRKKQWKRK